MIKKIIQEALKEDIGRGDIATDILIPQETKAKACIIAKESGIVAGINVAREVFQLLDKRIKFVMQVKEGRKVKKGTVIARIEGPARSILTAERTALNFLGRLSGIATLTQNFVQKVKPYKVKIMDTRKTTPSLRLLEKYAVRCGGGVNHRMGLWDGVLIKENHITLVTRHSSLHSLRKIVELARKRLNKGIPIEVEVRNLRELKDAIKARPDIILLDNMSISQIKKAVKIKNQFLLATRYSLLATIMLEVSGRVTLQNVRQIARAGVERISIGALTHSAKPLDFSLIVK